MTRRWLAWAVFTALGLGALATLSNGQRPPNPPPPALGRPLPGLGTEELARFETGREAFLAEEGPDEGLGPVFTENSCAKCHGGRAATGGSGTRLVTRFGRMRNGQFDPMIEFGGPLIQDRGIGRFNGVRFVGEVVPREATIVARRRTTALFGLGLVDAVPDAVFIALAQTEQVTSPATAGRPNLVHDPATGRTRVGKFGWKAQHATLFAFAGDAYTNEMGITTPLFPNENCPQGNCALLAANPVSDNPNEPDNQDLVEFTDFMTFLAPAPRTGSGGNAGQALFTQVGCAQCHTPTLQTGVNAVPALDRVVFAPYSDFLLHDMGPLGDGIVQEQAGPREMRTAPLWGLRLQETLLHDGRARTVDAAIRAHDGQARGSRNRYAALRPQQRDQLLAFLNSL